MRQLGKEFILVAEGLEANGADKMISMNASAALLWKAAQDKEFDTAFLVKCLSDEFDISREVAEKDVASLLQSWTEAGVVIN